MTIATALPKRETLTRTLVTLSLVGPLWKEANADDEAFLFFLLNIILLWVIAGFVWGIAGVLAVAYALVPTVFALLLGIMLFSGRE